VFAKQKINRDIENDKGEGERNISVKISRQKFPDFVFHITYKNKKKKKKKKKKKGTE
jgi:hypothetical protein